MSRPFVALSLPVLLVPLASAAMGPDWDAVADLGTIHVITYDEDGDERETKVWLAVLDGQGFIRTGSTTWGENVARNQDVVIRIEDVEYPLHADFIENEELRERVSAAFREKYGWQDVMVGWLRWSHPKIMHLVSR